jgi:hypothetical protein
MKTTRTYIKSNNHSSQPSRISTLTPTALILTRRKERETAKAVSRDEFSFLRRRVEDSWSRCATILTMLVALMPIGAYAQTHQDVDRATPPPAPVDIEAEKADTSATSAAAGATIYIADDSGELSTVTLGTYAVHRIGSEGVVLTDISFSPAGQLYGVSFTDFYKVDRVTGKATLIGPLGITDANALVFDAHGVAYTEGFLSSELYTIDTKTGEVSPVGSTAPYESAGALVFYNGGLVLAGVDSGTDTLVQLEPSTGKILAYSELNLANLFALASTGEDLLYGFAGTSLYRLLPGESNINSRTVLLKNLAPNGIAEIFGAAYDGNFQN